MTEYDPDNCLACYCEYNRTPASYQNVCYRCIVDQIETGDHYTTKARNIQSRRNWSELMHGDWLLFEPDICYICEEMTNTLHIALCQDHGGSGY